MLQERYDYKPINRKTIDGKRHYATPEGEAVPSVTTILDKTKPEEKRKALAAWKKRVGTEQAQRITTEAASRTRLHKWLEDYCITGELADPGSNPYSQQKIPNHVGVNNSTTNQYLHSITCLIPILLCA